MKLDFTEIRNTGTLKYIWKRVLLLIFITVSIAVTGNPSFSVDKVRIEYFGREDCKNCTNLKKFLNELSENPELLLSSTY